MGLCDRLETAQAGREAVRDRLAAAGLARLNAPDPESFQADARFALDTLPALTTRSDQIKHLRQTILNLAVRGKLVPQDLSDEPASELLNSVLALPWTRKRKLSELELDSAALVASFPLPSGWVWASVDALVRPNETVTYGILKPEWVPDGVPTVRVTEMKTGIIDVARLPKCHPARAARFQKTTLAPDDLLISKDGTIGKTALVPPELAGGNITQHVLRFPICDLVDRQYIRLTIDAPFCQAWMAGETKGVALQGVNVGDFRRMPIPLPPLAEQHRIVAKVDALMALCDRLEASLTATAATRRRLLDALLAEALAPDAERELEAAE
jgi:type I restriction enzyme, S subunit